MRTIVYKCDKCGSETTNKDEISRVKVYVQEPEAYGQVAEAEAHICNKCLQDMGITLNNSYLYKNENNKTLQDQLVDILVDLGVSFVE